MRRRADAQVLLPKGTRIAFAGGVDCNDHQGIWAVLDKVQAKHSDMVLLHGGTPRAAEKIAACWADARKVPQVVFKPDRQRGRLGVGISGPRVPESHGCRTCLAWQGAREGGERTLVACSV